MDILLQGGRVINPATNYDCDTSVLIRDGKIADIGSDIEAPGAECIDCSGRIVAPGLIDMHVHFREPGQEAKEDFLSGSKAAAAGGYTTVATMPNTSPAVDNAALVRSLKKRAHDIGLCNIEVIGALTKGRQGKELAEVGDMTEAGAVAFSDDGNFVDSARVMLNALDYLRAFDKTIICHEEETSLVEEGAMNEGHRSAMLGIKGRPTVAEDIAVARDILLAEYADARVHIAHISSARSVELVREAKRRGIRVTAEATPHHLTMTDDVIDYTDSATKVNPPLRSKKDTEAVLQGLLDGTIDAIVTDHSPHAEEEKDREYIYATSGFPGLETAVGVLMSELVQKGRLSIDTMISKMTKEPARILGLDAGDISIGKKADVVVIDPHLDWTVDASKFYTRGSHSPFVGRKLTGKSVLTIYNGRIVMRDGVVTV